MIPRRTAADLRKQAVLRGRYGRFDTTTGKGWDPQWDIELAKIGRIGGSGRIRLRPDKKTKRERTREQRAQNIEKNLEDMDEKIAEYHLGQAQYKPVNVSIIILSWIVMDAMYFRSDVMFFCRRMKFAGHASLIISLVLSHFLQNYEHYYKKHGKIR